MLVCLLTIIVFHQHSRRIDNGFVNHAFQFLIIVWQRGEKEREREWNCMKYSNVVYTEAHKLQMQNIPSIK